MTTMKLTVVRLIITMFVGLPATLTVTVTVRERVTGTVKVRTVESRSNASFRIQYYKYSKGVSCIFA